MAYADEQSYEAMIIQFYEQGRVHYYNIQAVLTKSGEYEIKSVNSDLL